VCVPVESKDLGLNLPDPVVSSKGAINVHGMVHGGSELLEPINERELKAMQGHARTFHHLNPEVERNSADAVNVRDSARRGMIMTRRYRWMGNGW